MAHRVGAGSPSAWAGDLVVRLPGPLRARWTSTVAVVSTSRRQCGGEWQELASVGRRGMPCMRWDRLALCGPGMAGTGAARKAELSHEREATSPRFVTLPSPSSVCVFHSHNFEACRRTSPWQPPAKRSVYQTSSPWAGPGQVGHCVALGIPTDHCITIPSNELLQHTCVVLSPGEGAKEEEDMSQGSVDNAKGKDPPTLLHPIAFMLQCFSPGASVRASSGGMADGRHGCHAKR